MLTVVTQNSRLPRRSALSGDRLVFGFGYPHCSVSDARCQVSPGFLAKSVTCSHQVQPISQPLPNSSPATNYVYVSRAGKLHTLAVVFRDPDSPLEEIRKASRGKHLICARPRHAPDGARTGALPQTARFSVVASSKSRQEQAGGQAAATSAARAAILPTLCSVDYRHQHIDMVTRGAPSSSRSNDPWPSHLSVWRSY